MGAAVAITRTESDAVALRCHTLRARDPDQVRRMLAIAIVLEGSSRLDAARQAGMDRQRLRDWVVRYNAGGIGALASRKPPGQAPKLTQAEMDELRDLVIKGPDPEMHKVIGWRCVDLRAEVKHRFSVTVSERTIGKWLRRMRLTRLQARPFHPKRDTAAQETLKKLQFPSQESLARQYRRDQCRDLVPGWLSAEEAINEWGRRDH
jgi:transposase